MIDFLPQAQTILTILGILGLFSMAYVYFRSSVAGKTIDILKDNVEALQEQAKINAAHITELLTKVTKLEAENSVLKDIPLGNIEVTQQKIFHLLEAQNKILLNMSTMSGFTNVNVGKQ